jgi:formate hydrogenlyase transcriptional activator
MDLHILNNTSFDEGVLMTLSDTPSGVAFTSRQPLIVNRADFGKFASPYMKDAITNGIHSGCVVPLISHGKALGTLNVLSKTDHAFHQDDADLLLQCSNQIALAVENALSYREIEMLKNKLAAEKLYLEDEIRTENNFDEIIGNSPPLLETFR